MSVLAVEVDRLTIGWGGTPLLKDLSFSIPWGDVFVILGGSGSGKSTILRHLIGLEVPMAGSVRFPGLEDRFTRWGPPPYGVLFQSGALFGSMTVSENVALPLRKWTDLNARAIRTIVCAKLRLVGLESFENHLPAEISGGMKKRAGIARAMALDPPLLFLDEPSAGLDPVTAVELDELILTLNQTLEATMVIVTHELASIFKVARNCILIDRGAQGIIAAGDPRELRDQSEDPRVRNFFRRTARTPS